jgi:hypothetical protein
MAANAWGWILNVVGVPTAALAAIARMSAIANNKALAAGFAIGAAVSSGVGTFLNPAGLTAGHRKASSKFRGMENRARVFREVSCTAVMTAEKLPVKLSVLVEEWNRADEESPHVATFPYKRAGARAGKRGRS